MTRAFPDTIVEPSRRVPVRVGRLRTAVRSTPARLTLWLVALLVVLLAYGATALVSNLRTGGQVDSVRNSSGPLAVAAQSLYRSLSDADATAAGAFLSGSPDSGDLRRRYDDDIAAAGAGLANASTGSAAGTAAITTIATQLPVYTGLVETARANNRLGYPVGAAYLREASNLMRTVLLPAANRLYGVATGRLAAESGGAGGYPFTAVGLGLVALAVLVRAQRYLTQRTRRVLNPGAALATLAVLAALAWQNLAWLNLSGHLDAAVRTGSDRVEVLAESRIATLQARADEALFLVARGSGQAFETDYQTIMAGLLDRQAPLKTIDSVGNDRALATRVRSIYGDLDAWYTAHTALRRADEGGDNARAVRLAIGSGADSAATAFTYLDQDFADGIALADADFRTETDRAARATTGIVIGLSALVLLALAGTAVGIRRRIAEYR